MPSLLPGSDEVGGGDFEAEVLVGDETDEPPDVESKYTLYIQSNFDGSNLPGLPKNV